MPRDKDVDDYFNNNLVLKKDNPEKFYTAVKRIGDGGTATVAIVTRISDNKEFAMKIIKYKSLNFTDKEYQNMHVEIGLL